eukprot:13404-Amphidinium_carterae.1
MTIRAKILCTPRPRAMVEQKRGEPLDYMELSSKLLEFKLQTSGILRDKRGYLIPEGREQVWDQSSHDLALKVSLINTRCSVEDLQYRVTADHSEKEFLEQTVMWMHLIGEVIIPKLQDTGSIRHEVGTLAQLIRFLYLVMGTEHMKDISHYGALGQYGDDGSCTQEGVEQIHVTDYGNKLYANVIKTEDLPDYAEISEGFTEEHKVLESLMGLNFLDKEGKLCYEDLGITDLPDAQETMLKVERFTFKKGLAWSLAYFAGTSIITAIVAMREACANYELYVAENGISLSPIMAARRCLGCGKKKNKELQKLLLSTTTQWLVRLASIVQVVL